MNVTRDVILDLLPVYISGEASPATKALIEDYLKQDEELAKKIRGDWVEKISAVAPSVLPPELELRAFRKTKSLLAWQRWLLCFAVLFTVFACSLKLQTIGGRLTKFQFLLQDYPAWWAVCIGLGVAFWVGYFALRRRLLTTVFSSCGEACRF